MKRILSLLVLVVLLVSLVSCGPKTMNYAEYCDAAMDAEVTVDMYVQAHQSWWDNKITVYAADKDGAYFLYEMACSEEDSKKLTPGTKIRVTGVKGEYAGEVEIMNATFEFLDSEDTYLAPAKDVTSLVGNSDLIKDMNELVAFKGMTVVACNDEGAAFEYQGGIQGKDIYFTLSNGTDTISFCVESYLTDSSSDVYKAVEGLNVGDVVDIEAFLYWYNGANPHVTKVTVK
ncbi:MAG: hypothetical protein J6V80_04155 [Clostridia bacterium]|nr:hypothetical protein [Clostridia bacterium]